MMFIKSDHLKNSTTKLLLTIGICCLTAWMGTNYILINRFSGYYQITPSSNEPFTSLLGTGHIRYLLFISGIALLWALIRLFKSEHIKGLLYRSFILGIVFAPVLTFTSLMWLITGTYVQAKVGEIVKGPNIVQSAASPDQVFNAYVVDKPSIDGPNHHLYIHNNITDETMFLTKLPEDIDYNEKIYWSKYNDIVVFQTNFKLIAYSVYPNPTPENNSCWNSNNLFYIVYEDINKPSIVNFPEPGTICYKVGNKEKKQLIRLD